MKHDMFDFSNGSTQLISNPMVFSGAHFSVGKGNVNFVCFTVFVAELVSAHLLFHLTDVPPSQNLETPRPSFHSISSA